MNSQMYFVAILAPEPVLSAAEACKADLHQRFGIKAALKSPAHITLLAPFHFNPANEHLLTEKLKSVADKSHAFGISLNGFDAFSKRTIFIKVENEPALLTLHENVKVGFSEIPGMKIKAEQQPFHPHMTIGNRDWQNDDFDKAWELYRDQKFNAGFTASKISLLRLEDGKWKTIVSYELILD